MKTPIIAAISFVCSIAVCLGDDPSPASDVKSAATKLAEAANYSWSVTTVVPEESRWKPGPSSGKVEKGGYVWMSNTMGDRTIESVMKGGKGVSKGEDGWKTPEEMDAARAARGNDQGGGGGGGRGGRRGGGGMAGRMMAGFKAPAEQASLLAADALELKKDGDAVAGALKEEAVQRELSFGGRRREGGEGPPPATDAKGTVKFWIKDGTLAKYEVHVEGKMSWNGNEMKIDRTRTTDIKDVGTTKLEVPEEAKAKLAAPAAPSAVTPDADKERS